ncbi:hypothetical protein M9Y10_018971 [Tritrichomonas musculus]|uniref:Uncharacterized protein n=1 Tax=Tritrichomonas musculus TaxID=1915356 RepID=A0ABR2HJ55_9EUKA
MNALVSKKMMKRIKKYIKTFLKVELSSSEEEEELSINEDDSINENEDILTDENNLIENQQKNEANNDGDSDFHTVLLIFKIYKLPGMFLLPEGYQDLAFFKKILYQVYIAIISIIIGALQLYAAIYHFIKKKLSVGLFTLNLLTRLYFLQKNLAYHIIDGIVHYKKVMKTLKEKESTFIYWFVIIVYAVAVVLFVVFFSVLHNKTITSIKSATYIENNSKWYKLSNQPNYPIQGFCLLKANENDDLKTEDFAMMTTLPRLYSFTKSGKCYIKPSMRGLFNTTMKYIFGADYEEHGIEIFCTKLSHDVTLVIRSEKSLNEAIKSYTRMNKTVKVLKKQFDVKNRDCISEQKDNCEKEWDIFTQYYWPNMYSNEYADFPGFGRYQIKIDSDLIFQPSFITSDNKLMFGNHYIVSGSFEDKWGIGLYIEM